MRKMICIVAALLAVAGNASTATVKESLVDFGVSPATSNVSVQFELWYPEPSMFTKQPPTCGASGILVGGNSFILLPGKGIKTADGTFSVALCDDHVIVPLGALYKVAIFQNNVAFSSGIPDITGAVKNPNNASWVSARAVPTSPVATETSGPLPVKPANETTSIGKPQQPDVTRLTHRRSATLVALYIGYGILQGLDAESTLRVVGSNSGKELNPIMSPFASRPAAFVAVKAALAVGTILAIDHSYKHHPRLATSIMASLDAGYTAIVAHNLQLSSSR